VVFGPHVWNFRDTVRLLLVAGGAIQVNNAAELEAVLRKLFSDAPERARLGKNAQQLVARQQGATERTIALLDRLLAERSPVSRAA
jgi:3-deoxy-D-manno-octulosonic-acid transferase